MNLLDIQNELVNYNNYFRTLNTKEELNKEGQFPTPIDLALEITKYTMSFFKSDFKVRFLEPALGTGIIYSTLLQSTDKHIEKAIGIEKDELLSKHAYNIWRNDILRVINKDFTQWEENEKFNLIITNPPYTRHHHLSTEIKNELQLKVLFETGLRVSGYAGLYVYFILLAHKFLEKDAISTWLIPAEFMSVNYGIVIKDYLTNLVQINQIHQYDIETSKFDNALVSSVVVIFTNESPQENKDIILSYGGNIDKPNKINNVTLKELKRTKKWSTLINRTDINNKENQTKPNLVLGDILSVRRGIATGNNNFFIMPWSKAKELNIPSNCYKFVLPTSSKITSNIVEVGNNGEPLIDDVLIVIDTDLDWSTIKKEYTGLYNYLEQGIQNGIKEGYILKNRKLWYKQEVREPAPFICNYMARKKKGSNKNPFRFIYNKSNSIVTNNYLMLYPKDELENLLKENPALNEKVCDFLNSISEVYFKDNGREYGGGLMKMEPKELASIPVDDFLNKIKEG